MKMLSLLLLLSSPLAFGGVEDSLSFKLGGKLKEAFQEVPEGKYQISLLASYQYANSTLPVFLAALRTYQIPGAFLPCETDTNSLNCQASKSFIDWYESQAPAPGGSFVVRAIMFEACEGYPCNFIKEATVSVEVNE